MLVYILRRLAISAAVIFTVILITFVVFFLGPSDPAGAICGESPSCTPERVDQIAEALGLNVPPQQQFKDFIGGIFMGREISNGGFTKVCEAPCLGWSYYRNAPVTDLVLAAFPVTASLVFGGMVVYVVIALVAGVVAAKYRGTFIDRIIVGFSQTVSSIPYYVCALIFFLYAMVFTGIVPRSAWVEPWKDPVAWFLGLIGVWLFYGTWASASYIRYVRASMIDVQNSDYVRTARAKGLSETTVSYKHALRAAIAPFVTLVGLSVSAELMGAIFTETIFGLPGMGKLAIESFGHDDLPVIAGTVIVGAVLVTLGNLIVDLLYGVIDPRVRLQ
ncbi:ABC transporter permease [Kytococcus sp. HMSC28H12]|uniref:ABC transporter permease n=1 Tax=Kytococcus sp. HMSC28H12 TaxID=1581067 RepID=UPI0008A63339|nr:ABC transporter permease [Kytococcus sp. HMSC28H12]OFS15934.1 ABC transporter permease [Kytococcus sp. HMSC28H12]